MALRSRVHVLLDTASKSETAISGGGLRGFLDGVRQRMSTGKLLRLDVEDDVLRKPVDEAAFRFPSPGAQPTPVVPQGPYEKVFDITYHNRDARRRNMRENVSVEEARSAGLPPTPGTPIQSNYLGLAGDFDRQK